MKSKDIKQIRAFDRFYTRTFRLTDKYHLHTNFTLLEARILLEIGEHHRDTASQLIQDLAVDKGYLSRVLKKLVTQDLLQQTADETDKRVNRLTLTTAGQTQLSLLNRRADEQVNTLFAGLSAAETDRLITAMQYVEDHVQALTPPLPPEN